MSMRKPKRPRKPDLPKQQGPFTAHRLAHALLHGLPDRPPVDTRILRAETCEHVPKNVADGAAQVLGSIQASTAIEASIRAPNTTMDVSLVDHQDGTWDVAVTIMWGER